MLDKAFARGELGKVMDHVSGVLPDAPSASQGKSGKKGPSRQKLLYEITSGATPSKAFEAFEKFRKAFGLPDEPEALLPGLDHDDQSLLLDVIRKLDEIVSEQGPPRRHKTLLARLRMIEDDFNADQDVREAAAHLASKL